MSQVIRISDELYNRLKSHAQGFDTPANVIERILNTYEVNGFEPVNNIKQISEATSLDISYGGMTEEEFKDELLKVKHAFITLFFTDGTKNTKRWNASKFTSESSLSGNLRSGFLRGWRQKGIYQASLSFKEMADK